jgi:hypothetical protein
MKGLGGCRPEELPKILVMGFHFIKHRDFDPIRARSRFQNCPLSPISQRILKKRSPLYVAIVSAGTVVANQQNWSVGRCLW